jgi:hypothetical protein
MTDQERDNVALKYEELQKGDWRNLTLQQKKDRK